MKRLFNEIRNLYGPALAVNVAYMLQVSEYQFGAYLRWLWRARSFSKLRYRKDLIRTKPALVILNTLRLMLLAGWILVIYHFWQAAGSGKTNYYIYGTALLFGLPLLISHLIILPLLIGKILRWPYNLYCIRRSAKLFSRHKGLKIVIAGSYGKTSMKEMLTVVLSQTKKVAATKGNKNVPISHARFAETLAGDEEVLIIELGEGAPGDVAKFARTIKPNLAVITGLAPAHLDKYPSLKAVAKDFMSLSNFVAADKLYLNADSKELAEYAKGYQTYSIKGAMGWRVSSVKTSLSGTSFTLTKATRKMHIKSQLLGLHQVGPMALTAALATELGANFREITAGFRQLKPVDHRMNAYSLGGAWFIDDTYNGNIEGMAAGLQLLDSLSAKRKVYVTPGLVDQGNENVRVHSQLGKLIAKANPDQVVLINNSVTKLIKAGLIEAKYKGEVIIEADPLKFYSNLEHRFAAGDLVLMQNDWPDQYS